MALHIPKLREGSYFPSLLEPRRRSEKALLAVIQQAYVEGVSTVNDGLEMSHFYGLKLNHLVFAQRFGQCA